MKRGCSFVLVFSILFSGIMLSGDCAYSWTTEFYQSPVGHEVLTKEGAYDAGSYYHASDFCDFVEDWFSDNSQFSYGTVVTAGWGKRLKRALRKVASVTPPVVAAVVMVAVVCNVPMLAVCYMGLKMLGVWNNIVPYYGTYSDRTASLIAGSRYQDIKEFGIYSSALREDQRKVDNQKYHFLRRNDQPVYNPAEEIDNETYGIKFKGIVEPIIEAVQACNAPKRYYYIGGYDKINVIPDHFAMGKVLHTVQDSYAHTMREGGTGLIREVKVYAPKDGSAHNYQHEGTCETLLDPQASHDRIYSYDDGFFGLHGSMKPEARAAKSATRSLLELWKNRNKGWAGKSVDELKETYFKSNTPWAAVVNSICAHR